MVFEMPSAERFVPRPVRVQPLDGTRVWSRRARARAAWWSPSGAGLIAQVR